MKTLGQTFKEHYTNDSEDVPGSHIGNTHMELDENILSLQPCVHMTTSSAVPILVCHCHIPVRVTVEAQHRGVIDCGHAIGFVLAFQAFPVVRLNMLLISRQLFWQPYLSACSGRDKSYGCV